MFHIIGVCFTKKRRKKSACTQHQVADMNPKFPVYNQSKTDNSTDDKQMKNGMLTSSMTLFTEI
jgi:hypothetical protein